MKKRFLRIISGICALVCLLCGCDGGVGEVTPKDVVTDADTVRVMSFNICGWNYKKIKNLVPRLILEYSPDVIGLQECTYDWYQKLTKEMPDYEFVGAGRENGKIDSDCGEMCAILFKKDKYTLVDSGTFWLSETPEQVSLGWDADYLRVCTWVILKDNESGEEFAHVNVHTENFDDGTGREACEKGTQMVVEKGLSFDMPVIMTGDWNFEKDTDLYGIVTGAGFLDAQDAAESTMEGVTCPDADGSETGEHIDYIFINDRVASVSVYKILHDSYDGQYPSDHYPIYADMKLWTK